jgi:Spy/CpxP family protein refolding chaperone
MNDRPRALAVLIAVFLFGCVAGSAGSYFWFRNRAVGKLEVPRFRPGPGQGRQRIPELQLTPDQEAQFGRIMGEMRNQIDTLRKEQEPKFEAIRSETSRKLTSILNEEQKKKFTLFLKEMEERRMRPPHENRGMDGPPPPPPDLK